MQKFLLKTQLLAALESHSDVEVKTFLLNQLNLVGSDKTVDATKKYLTDTDLVEPVTQTLTSIGSEKAAQALAEALPNVEDDASKTTLIRALGVLQYKPAVNQITDFVECQKSGAEKSTLAALANIGDANSYKILYKAAKNVDFAYEPTDAAEAFLNYANRLGEENQTALCKKACKAIFKANQSDEKLA